MYGIFVHGPWVDKNYYNMKDCEEAEEEEAEEEEAEEETVELAITEVASVTVETVVEEVAVATAAVETPVTLKRENTEHEHDTDNYDFVKETI